MRINLPGIGEIQVTRRKRSKEDETLLTDLKNMVKIAQESMKVRHEQWRRYDEYYNGIHLINRGIHGILPGELEKEDRDKVPINFCRSTVEQMIPIMMDAAPVWYAVYEGQDTIGGELAEGTTDFIQGFWYYVNVDDTLKEVLRDFVVYGTGCARGHWDRFVHPVLEMEGVGESAEAEEEEREEAEAEETGEDEVEDAEGGKWQGDVAVEWCDPYCLFPDPTARKIEDCRFVAFRIEITEEDFERQFPHADKDDVSQVSEGRLEQLGRRDQEKDRIVRRENLIEIWEVYHEFGKRMTLYTGKQILWDDENPTPDYKFPVVMFTNCKRGSEMWGRSEMHDLIGVQDFMNLSNYRIAKHLRLTANPQKVTNDASIKSITNEAGEVIHVKPQVATGIPGFCNWEVPPPLNPQLFTWLAFLGRAFDTMSGIQDVTQGIKPKGVTSGIALGILNEAGQARLRLMIAVIAIGLEKLGQLVLELMQENYTESRQIAFMGEGSPQTAEIETGALKHAFLSGTHRMPFRVIVQSRGDLPTNPAAQLDIALQMFMANGIDRQELLTVAKWPRRDEIVRRMEEKEMMQMQGQMAAMGAAGGVGGMPAGAGGAEGAEELPGVEPGEMERLLAAFTEEERVIIEDIIRHVAAGVPPPAEYEDFVRGLDEDKLEIFQAIVGAVATSMPSPEGAGVDAF